MRSLRMTIFGVMIVTFLCSTVLFAATERNLEQGSNAGPRVSFGPEIDVRGGSPEQSISDGDATPSTSDGTNMGNGAIGGAPVEATFLIHNTGFDDLHLQGDPRVSIAGANPGDFTISAQPAAAVLPGDSSSFTARFSPTATGLRSATLHIANDDEQYPDFDFVIQGTGVASAPAATTEAASGETSTRATLHGQVNANGDSATVTFDYGPTTSYGSIATADQSPVGGASDVAVSADVGSLTPNSSYHYRVVAQNGVDTSYGSDMSFSTAAVAPTAATSVATGVGATAATLRGTVNANNDSTEVWFEYGPTTSYGSTMTADQSPASGTAPTAVSAAIASLAPNSVHHYRVVARNSADTSYGADMSFSTSAIAPTVTTNPATNVGADSAVLNGLVNANNDSTTVTFAYGPTVAYGSTATADQSPVTGSDDTAVTSTLSGLAFNTTYHYRVVGQNGSGTSQGEDQSFTTGVAAPTVTTTAATNVDTRSATLNGSVNANNNETTVTFQFGATTSYGEVTPAAQSPLGGASVAAVSADLSNLTPNTSYHFRAVGQNDGGASYGQDLSFTTSPAAPTAATSAATNVTAASATLNGLVNANNDSSTVIFEYGLTASYGSTVTAAQSPVNGTSDVAVSAALTGLTSNSVYHYRVVAQNNGGADHGADMTFTTGLAAPTVATGGATSVTTSSAIVHGAVNANDHSSAVTFEYGQTTSYGQTVTAAQSPATGTGDTAVSARLGGLTHSTTFHYRVVGQNVDGTSHGADRSFVTSVENDGVPNAEEDGAPTPGGGAGDGNGDGVADKDQPDVASLRTFDAAGYCTLDCADVVGAGFENVTAVDPATSDAPVTIDFPYGQFAFDVTGIAHGETVTLKLFLERDEDIEGFFKKNRLTGRWENLAVPPDGGVDHDSVRDKTVLTFQLTDGGPHDQDGQVNGVIQDDGGPGYLISYAGAKVPALSAWGVLAMGALLAGLLAWRGRSRERA